MSSHYFTNLEIADLLRNVAAALQLESEDKNRFRIIAYNRAADAIEHASSDIKDLWDNHELDSVAGIGESIASYIDELFSTGKVRHFDQVIKANPPAFYELLKVPGIGPKTAYKLAKEHGLSKKAGSISKLKKLALKGLVPEHLVQSITSYSDTPSRMLLHQAEVLAQDLISYLQKCPQVIEVHPLGSLRRHVSTIGDIDLAVSTQVPSVVIDYFCNYPRKSQIYGAGNTKASIELRDGVRVDLMTCDPDSYGSLLQHLTGSKHHNIALREYAQKLGLSLSEYGIKPSGSKKLTTFRTEKEFYHFLKLDYIPPELREDTGEIQAALTHKLPGLVEGEQIKGDLHIHSSFDTEPSHDVGQHPLMAIAERAGQLGYAYFGLAEHNPSVSTHDTRKIYSIMSKKRAMIDQYNNSRQNLPFCFNGLEIDILSDGQLALPLDCLDLLDYAIVSIHSSFRQNPKDMTSRIISGLSHPKALILGHPTGRLLNEREGVSIEWDILFKFCKQNHKILEIDAWPNRLDLPDVLVREAVKSGVKMIIDSDSHSIDHMTYLPLGIAVARRGWAQSSDIINTYSLKDMTDLILEGRGVILK